MRTPEEKIVVEMVRFSGTHRYLLGLFDTLEEAKACGDKEMTERGGKYGYEVFEPHTYLSPTREINELVHKQNSPYEKIP